MFDFTINQDNLIFHRYVTDFFFLADTFKFMLSVLFSFHRLSGCLLLSTVSSCLNTASAQRFDYEVSG